MEYFALRSCGGDVALWSMGVACHACVMRLTSTEDLHPPLLYARNPLNYNSAFSFGKTSRSASFLQSTSFCSLLGLFSSEVVE